MARNLNAGISWDRNFQNAVLARLDRINHDGIRAWPSVVWLAYVNKQAPGMRKKGKREIELSYNMWRRSLMCDQNIMYRQYRIEGVNL